MIGYGRTNSQDACLDENHVVFSLRRRYEQHHLLFYVLCYFYVMFLCYVFMLCFMLCYVMFCFVLLCYVMLCCVMLCYVMSRHWRLPI